MTAAFTPSADMEIKTIHSDHGRIKFFMVNGDPQVQEYAEFVSIFVDEGYRHKGEGTELMNKFANYAKGNGAKFIRVCANTDYDDWFGKFLQKNGMEIKFMKVFEKTI